MPTIAQNAEAALAALVAENARLARCWNLLGERAEEDDDADLIRLMNDIEFGE